MKILKKKLSGNYKKFYNIFVEYDEYIIWLIILVGITNPLETQFISVGRVESD